METSGNEKLQTDGGSATDLMGSSIPKASKCSKHVSASNSIPVEDSTVPEPAKSVLSRPSLSKRRFRHDYEDVDLLDDSKTRGLGGAAQSKIPDPHASSTVYQSTGGSARPSSGPPKKPLRASASNLLQSVYSTTASKSALPLPEKSRTVQRSTTPARPKPPLAAKPSKPEVKPKPVYLSSTELRSLQNSRFQQSHGASSKASDTGLASVRGEMAGGTVSMADKTRQKKLMTAQSDTSLPRPYQSGRHSPSVVRKTHSENDLEAQASVQFWFLYFLYL